MDLQIPNYLYNFSILANAILLISVSALIWLGAMRIKAP